MKIILLICLILAVYTHAGALDRIKTSAINAISNVKTELQTFGGVVASELQLWPLLLHIDVNSQDMKQAWNTFLTELNDDKIQPINAIGHFCVNFFKIWVKIGKTLSTPFDN